MLFLLIPAIVAAVWGGYSLWKREQAVQLVTLDAGLPPAAESQVLTAIATATSPAQLTAMASQYAAYPYTAYELQLQAWVIGGKQGPAPQAPTGPGQSGTPTRVVVGPTGQPEVGAIADLDALAQEAIAAAAGMMGTTSPPVPTTDGQPSPGGPSVPPPAAANVPPGPGWTGLPSSVDSQYTWSDAAAPSSDTTTEIARLTPILNGTFWEQAPDGTVWKFMGATGVVIAYLGTAATQQTGQYSDPMASYAPFTPEFREDVMGYPSVETTAGDAVEAAGRAHKHIGVDTTVKDRGRFDTGFASSMSEGSTNPAHPPYTHQGHMGHAPGPVPPPGPSHGPGPVPAPPSHPGGPHPSPFPQPHPRMAHHSPGPMPPPGPGRRPIGSAFMRVRETDRIWPRKLAEIGSGVRRGSPGALQHLADINPHLAPGGVMRQLQTGDEVNVPASWVPNLKSKRLLIEEE